MPDWYLDWILEQLKKQKQKEEQKMTTEHALASFESGFSHPDFALTTEGAEAYEIACQAMREKIERDNQSFGPLLSADLFDMNDTPVKVHLLNENNFGLTVGVLSMTDPNNSDNGVYLGNSFYSINEYGKTWVCYKYKPKEV